MRSNPREPGGPPESGPGSQRALREANETRLLAVLGTGGHYSQADLVRASGLSPSTVSVTVKRLEETGRVLLETGTSNGRRAVLVTATGGSVLAAGLDIGRSHARILLGTSLENVIGDQELHLPERHTPDETIPKIGEALASMIVASGHALSDLKCVGVGLPGPVDEVAGVVTGGSILPTWVDRPVGAMLRSTLGAQICLENDANLGAYAIAKTVRPAVGTLLYVKVGTGVGAGAIVGGRLLQGSSGLAGEIGHLPSLDGGPQCRCGRRGCLETIASAEAIRAGLSDVLERDLSNEDVVELAREDSGVVRRVVAEAGHALGRGLAAASCMLDPGLIVIGGPLVGLGDLLLEPMRQAFERNALPAIARSTTIVMSSLEQPPEAFGALMLGLKDPGVIRHDRVR